MAKELAAANAGKAASDQDEKAKKTETDNEANNQDLHEVELGTYNVTRFNPGTNTTLAIDFELYGTVLAEDPPNSTSLREKQCPHREQIMLTMHGAEAADLTDAGLGLIKRQILEKTNRALGQPMLKEVLFSKFNFVER